MEQFWRKKTFKVLLIEWNKKLEQSGFEDAEVELKEDRALKQRSTNSYRQADQLERESRLEYYSFLGHLAHSTIFPNELEKFVMLRHSEGALINEIADELLIKGLSQCKNRWRVRHIIRRWQMKWGIKSWSLQQMNLKKAIG